MVLTKKKVEELEDGTKLKVFVSGSGWAKDFGKVFDVIKLQDRLYIVKEGYFETEQIDADDGSDIVVASYSE